MPRDTKALILTKPTTQCANLHSQPSSRASRCSSFLSLPSFQKGPLPHGALEKSKDDVSPGSLSAKRRLSFVVISRENRQLHLACLRHSITLQQEQPRRALMVENGSAQRAENPTARLSASQQPAHCSLESVTAHTGTSNTSLRNPTSHSGGWCCCYRRNLPVFPP